MARLTLARKIAAITLTAQLGITWSQPSSEVETRQEAIRPAASERSCRCLIAVVSILALTFCRQSGANSKKWVDYDRLRAWKNSWMRFIRNCHREEEVS